MKNLSMIAVVICGTSPWAHADSLSLNAARPESSPPSRNYYYAPTPAVAPVPTYTTATVTDGTAWATPDTETVPTAAASAQPIAPHADHVTGGCPCGGHGHGGSGQYPWGCCEPDASCCAALWANYCAEKKPCWQPHSPRRHSGACGFCVPKLTLPCFDAFSSLHRPKSCDCVPPCDSQSLSVTPLSGDLLNDDANGELQSGEALEDETLSPSDLPTDALPQPSDVGPVEESPSQPVPPPLREGANRRKLGFPFNWKSATRAKSNPFNRVGKKSELSFPSAR